MNSPSDIEIGIGYASVKREGEPMVLAPMTYRYPVEVIITGAKYVVTSNNPYYPSVEYFLTLEDANAYANDLLAEKQDSEGNHDCIISVCQVLDSRKVKMPY
jgi:hypothetical protein